MLFATNLVVPTRVFRGFENLEMKLFHKNSVLHTWALLILLVCSMFCLLSARACCKLV